MTSRISSKGQITIPLEVRKSLHIQPGDTVVFELNEDGAVLRRVEPFDLAFHKALSSTLDEWDSPEDEEAFRDL